MTAQRNFFRDWFDAFVEDFLEHKDHLGDLDRQAGDGDFAVNLHSALRRAAARVDELPLDAADADVLRAISLGFIDTGGSSGPLLGVWFRGIAKAFTETSEHVTAVAVGVRGGTDAVQRLGGAQMGDKTMVDAMIPAAVSLEHTAAAGGSWSEALHRAAEDARAGANSTQALTASLGRASYVGESASGVIDPGALAIALFFESGARVA